MKRHLRWLILLCCLPLLLGAKRLDYVKIYGLKGKVLTNIESRLDEFSKIKPLWQESNEGLIAQVSLAMSAYGYLKPHISLHRSEDGKILNFNIIPGPRLVINQLYINIIGDGAKNPDILKVLSQLPIQQGKPFDSAAYELAKETLTDAAEHEGYLHAAFEKSEILIDKQRYTLVIKLVLNTGPQYYFGQVRFEPTYISPELLQRYIPFKFGQPYSTEQLLAFNSYLASSGYFSSVSVKPELNDHRTIPINVYMQEAKRINYSLGIGYGTDTGIRGRAGFHVIPVNHKGHKFNAIALGSFNQNTLQAQYIIPGKNPLTDEYNISGNLSNLDYNSGYSNSLLTTIAQRHTVDNYQRILSINGLYERFNYEDAPKLEKLSLFPKATLSWSNTSENLFSPSGYHITLNGLAANKAVLSEVSFAQASVDARAAITLTPLRTRFYFHTIQGITQIDNVNELPLSLALLLGGSDNLKAYSFNSVGPGKILTYTGFEIQKETFENWYLIGIFDSGDVYMPSLKSIKNDVGIGLMWISPIGPIKIGVVQAVNNRLNREPGTNPRFVVNMGPDL